MNDLRRPANPGQVVSLEKSARYWSKRAEQHRKRGEHHRAAALLRHAVDLEPASGDLLMEYAQTLRDMSCFEASNRAAFNALALSPGEALPYNLIGRNMLSLGREQEAVDAFAHYLHHMRVMPPEALYWDDETYELEDWLSDGQGRGTARYDALVHIASLRLARGNIAGSQKALKRAERNPAADTRLNALYAMLYQALEKPARALEFALASARENPHHVPTLCALASIYVQLDQKGKACGALMAAAVYCRYPHEEQLFCFTAAALGMENLALDMLRSHNRKTPDRLPTLSNLAILLLRRGQIPEAMGYLHMCRDLDPDDLTILYLFQLVTEWEEQGLPPEKLRTQAEALSFYPFLPLQAQQLLLEALARELSAGLESFSGKLCADTRLERMFLYALTLPTGALGRLLYPIATLMAQESPAAAQRMLRSVLMQNTPDSDVKRYALSALVALGAPAPYVVWQNGRIMQAAPESEVEKPVSVIQRLLKQRIRHTALLAKDNKAQGHALRLLYRMDRRDRFAFAADPAHIWPFVMAKHFALHTGGPVPAEPYAVTQHRDQAQKALGLLCALEPIAQEEEP